jgi:single-stranded-DNA-specific exonuclease
MSVVSPDWASLADARQVWELLAQGDPVLLRQALLDAFLDGGELHSSQAVALDALDRGRNVLAILGTGRGKSLIFQLHAVELALRERETSLLIYPLRALASDQAYHLSQVLAPFGLSVQTLNGDSTPIERAAVVAAMREGRADVVLTTPEFLERNPQAFEGANIRFVVVDEAHHLATSKAGFRPAYPRLGELIDALGSPQVMACTATADERITATIVQSLHIDETITDPHVRWNLSIDDQRNIRRRERYLVNLVVQGEKTIVYVNSRFETLTLARSLRKQVPQMAPLIGFYNAGLSREERAAIEEMFRTDELQVLIATSAFGEGVNVPGVRHVVLYHLPFSEVEFNQMSGRAGRDGDPATIHLLFGKRDTAQNEAILAQSTPDRDSMGQVYRYLRHLQRKGNAERFETSLGELARAASSLVPPFDISPTQVACALDVFGQLGLVETEGLSDDRNSRITCHVVDFHGKVELTESVRYREGLDELDSFESFRHWVMRLPVDRLEDRIRKPLLP